MSCFYFENNVTLNPVLVCSPVLTWCLLGIWLSEGRAPERPGCWLAAEGSCYFLCKSSRNTDCGSVQFRPSCSGSEDRMQSGFISYTVKCPPCVVIMCCFLSHVTRTLHVWFIRRDWLEENTMFLGHTRTPLNTHTHTHTHSACVCDEGLRHKELLTSLHHQSNVM